MSKEKSDKPDKTLERAVDLARQSLLEIAQESQIGAHLGTKVEAERLLTHFFACHKEGYRGWRWAAVLARVPRSRTATVCEIALLPGEDSLLAPDWVPWAERIRPGDVSRADILPYFAEDERLIDTREADPKLGVDTDTETRLRVLSETGIRSTYRRWKKTGGAPLKMVATRGQDCSTCGFLVPIGKPLGRSYGVCANEWSQDDGRVVSLKYSCGSHSETDEPKGDSPWPVTSIRLDECNLETVNPE